MFTEMWKRETVVSRFRSKTVANHNDVTQNEITNFSKSYIFFLALPPPPLQKKWKVLESVGLIPDTRPESTLRPTKPRDCGLPAECTR